MTRKLKSARKHPLKRLRRKLKRQVYRFLLAIYEGELRITFFGILCTLFCLTLFVGCFFPVKETKEAPTTVSVLGSELTNALHFAAASAERAELNADITLLLIPEPEDTAALSLLLESSLYGFYLSGKELLYLPEYYASLSDVFPDGIPYIGGLSFSYNPKRLPYNRATNIALLKEDGTLSALSGDTLYYVIGNESVFTMFRYLSGQTFHLLEIQPKNAAGLPVSDYSELLLRGQNGSCTFHDIYRSYLLSGNNTGRVRNAGETFLCPSFNTVELFSQLNGAGYFLLGCFLLLFALTLYIRPQLRRIRIWFRIFLIRRRKRGKFNLRGRVYTARSARKHAA